MQPLIRFEFPVIDLRSADNYIQRHLINSANIPVEELQERTHELPEKSTPINLIGESSQVEIATDLLESKGYSICASLVATPQLLGESFPPSKLTSGTESKRFWKPASVVQYFCDRVVSRGDSMKGLDLACGAGRDSIYLALNGWQMTSVDSSEHALLRVKGSAARANLKVSCLQLDLERNVHELLELGQSFDLIVVVRYLHRPLLPLLAELLNDSGYIIYQTFMQGCEQFGSPKNPRFLLKQDELAKTFPDFQVIRDEVELLTDGRPVNSFIAQKIIK